MKRKLLFAAILIASALGGNLYAQFDADKVYTIECNNQAGKYMQDNGDGYIVPKALNNNSYWKFESTANDGCYYVKNAKTGLYMQKTSEYEVSVKTGTNPVEIYIKNDPAKGTNVYGLASTDRDPHDFANDNTWGANYTADYVQGYSAALGGRPNSFWKIVEATMPEPQPATFDSNKTYTIANNNDANMFMQDQGDASIALGSTNDKAYWKFIPTENAYCYFIQNAKTGKYIQGYSSSEQEVSMGDAGVEYYVKADADGSLSGRYRLSCTANDPHDFSDGTLGLNWKNNNTVQSFASVAGGNPRSAWIVTEATMPDPAPIEATPVESLASYAGSDPYIYDQASMKYYALNNLGQYEEYGVFTEVSTLSVAGDAVKEIEYIKSPNNAYINLNYIPKANSKVVCTLQAETGGDWKAAYGCGYYQNGWKDRFCFFTTNATINLGGETGNRDAMAYGRKIVTVLDAAAGKMDIFEDDGTTLIGTITDSPKNADCKTPLYVFAQNKDVPGGDKITDCYNPFITLYGLKLYEGETLVMDLVPAVNGEGKGGLKDKLTGTFYGSANSSEFELSADGQTQDAGIPVYEGKIVTYNNHEYRYIGGGWVDLGEMAYQNVDAIGTDYKNLSNWSYPGSAYDATFGRNVFDGTTNTINPYEGNGGWEPLSYKLTGLEKGENYRFSFDYTGTAWHSWSSYTTLPVFVLDNENMPDNAFNNPDAALGYVALPNTETNNLSCSTAFKANHSYALLCIQFGVVDDGSHDPAFAFSFSNIKVEKRVYPKPYATISWVEPVKYTALEYIENISAPRERAFTLPYTPVTATQIDMKFSVNDKTTGWSAIFCGRNFGAGTGISLYMNNNRSNFGYFTGGTTGAGDNFAPFSLNTVYTITADVTKLVVNGETYGTGNTATNATSRKLSLFANPENDNPMRGPIYYCTISEGGETIYDFKPVMRHDGVFGFYDKASKTFVLPAQGGNLDGYGYKKLDDQAYVTYKKDTRIVVVGATAQFLPEVQNISNATFTWTSSDETKATVAADGTVTGVAAGKVTITATTTADDGWTASYELTVSEPEYKRYDANNVGYAIVTGGNGWGDSPVSGLLDNDATTKFGTSNVGEAWAIMIASEPVAVQQYSIVTGADTYNYPSRNPVSWKLEGSNDNQNWTVIDEQIKSYKLQAKNREEFVFPVNGTETYRFFKFTATQLADGFQVGEFWINAQTHTWDEPTTTASTCTVKGEKVWESDCKVLKTEVLPLADHTYTNGVCTVCSAKATEVVLLPTRGDDNTPYYAKFRYAEGVDDAEYVDIEADWTEADFDDSAWGELMMPLGSFGPHHTRWVGEYNTFWFRRSFLVNNPAEIIQLTLKVTHDDDCAVFLNGKKVWNESGWTGGENDWRTIEISPEDLVAGKNVLAMYIEQNFGGAYCDFGLEAKTGIKVTITDAGYATFVAPFEVDVPSGMTASTVEVNADGVTLDLTDVNPIPANTPVVLAAAAATYSFEGVVDATSTNPTYGALTGTYSDIYAPEGSYILQNQNNKVGFYQVDYDYLAAQNMNRPMVRANRAYLTAPANNSNPVKAFFFDEVDAIDSLNAQSSTLNQTIYNVAGQRQNKVQRGVNIVNGHKVVVK